MPPSDRRFSTASGRLGQTLSLGYLAAFLNSNQLPSWATPWEGLSRSIPGSSQLDCQATQGSPLTHRDPHAASPADALAAAVAHAIQPSWEGSVAACEVSAGLKSSAMVTVARRVAGAPLLGVASAVGFRHAAQILATARELGVVLAVSPPPPSDPGVPRSWARLEHSDHRLGAGEWARLAKAAVAVCGRPINHQELAPLLRYEQARRAGIQTLIAGNDLGLASFLPRRQHGPTSRPASLVARGFRRSARGATRAAVTATGSLRGRVRGPDRRGRSLPGLLRQEFAQLPEGAPTEAFLEEARSAPRGEAASRIRRQELNDQILLAASVGVRLEAPLANPHTASLLGPPEQGSGRTRLMQLVNSYDPVVWSARRVPPPGPPKWESEGFARGAARFAALLSDSPRRCGRCCRRPRLQSGPMSGSQRPGQVRAARRHATSCAPRSRR